MSQPTIEPPSPRPPPPIPTEPTEPVPQPDPLRPGLSTDPGNPASGAIPHLADAPRR